MHGERMASDEEASKVDPGDGVETGVETGELTDVIADGEEQTLHCVCLTEICVCIEIDKSAEWCVGSMRVKGTNYN